MWNKNPLTFLGCGARYDDARVVLFGAPFDGTASFRPGARFACACMRQDSVGLETYSPYQDKDLCDIAVFDGGDLELPFGDPLVALGPIERAAAGIINDGKIPCMIGGEHLVTLGAVRAAAAKHPDLHLIHLDAHTDLRDDYLGEHLSHATVIRRVWDLLGDGRIYQFGIRSGEKHEFEFAREHTMPRLFDLAGMDALPHTLRGRPVYLSVDLDVLDPGVFPGTGTPEPGGVSFGDLLRGLLSLKGLDIVACDLTELTPHYDHSGASTAAACKVLRELLLLIGG